MHFSTNFLAITAKGQQVSAGLEQGPCVVEHMTYISCVGAMARETVISLKKCFHCRIFQFVGAHLIAPRWTCAKNSPGGAFVKIVPSKIIRIEQSTYCVVDAKYLCITSGTGTIQAPRHCSEDVARTNGKR